MQHVHDHEHHEHKNLNDREKFIKRIELWIRHNEEHLQGYIEWQQRCTSMGLDELTPIFDHICKSVKEQNKLLSKVLNTLKESHI